MFTFRPAVKIDVLTLVIPVLHEVLVGVDPLFDHPPPPTADTVGLEQAAGGKQLEDLDNTCSIWDISKNEYCITMASISSGTWPIEAMLHLLKNVYVDTRSLYLPRLQGLI